MCKRLENYLTKEGEELYKNVREYFSKLISIKTTDQEFKKTKEITQILFERTKKIKKEFNLKF